jgi:hypothetical protein
MTCGRAFCTVHSRIDVKRAWSSAPQDEVIIDPRY